MEESATSSIVSDLTNDNENLSKCSIKNSSTSTNNFSNYRSSFSSYSTNRTTLSIEEIESRRSGFEQFITSLPKICSPTICGTLNYRSPTDSSLFSSVCSSKVAKDKSRKNDTSGYQTGSLKKVHNETTMTQSVENSKNDYSTGTDEQIEFRNPFEEKIDQMLKQNSNKTNQATASTVLENEIEEEEEANINFDWSIDQIAQLNPCDITFDGNFLLYKEFEEHNRLLLDKESEQFFAQNVIAPSPIVNTPVIARKRLLQNMQCKTSSPFMDYLNSKKKSLLKTPLQLSGIQSTSSSIGLSSKTPRHQITQQSNTPINDLSIVNTKNLPKKKLFSKFECSSNQKSMINHSNISPSISEISSNATHINRLNCTDLECRRFTLDISNIGDLENFEDAVQHDQQIIKSSTNRKEMNRLIEDLLEEDEDEIAELNLNDTNEDLNSANIDENEPQKQEINVNEHKDERSEIGLIAKTVNENSVEAIENRQNEDDLRMSISILHEPINKTIESHSIVDTSLMECSFQQETVPTHNSPCKSKVQMNSNHQMTNVNELMMNRIEHPPIETVDELSIERQSDQRESQDQSMMETSTTYSMNVNNFNDEIDPTAKIASFKKTQQLTSTPFR